MPAGLGLRWRETAQVFQTSWEAVYRSVEWFVEWGLDHRQLCGVESIGVDEIHWGHGMKADNFLTVLYQIDAGCRRLLWIGKRRSEKTLRLGLKMLVTVAQREPAARTRPQEAQRPARQQDGYRSGLGIERGFWPFLEVQIGYLDARISGCLVRPRPAQPP